MMLSTSSLRGRQSSGDFSQDSSSTSWAWVAAGRLERVGLAVRVLLPGGDACVSDRCHAANVP